jgi:hypothetical protein
MVRSAAAAPATRVLPLGLRVLGPRSPNTLRGAGAESSPLSGTAITTNVPAMKKWPEKGCAKCEDARAVGRYSPRSARAQAAMKPAENKLSDLC